MALPIRPKPIRPRVVPWRSTPSRVIGPQVFHFPSCTYRSASGMRRATAIISAKAKSAVASVSTSGVFPTGILRAVAALTSMLSKPTAWLLITFSCGPASSIISPSILSVSKHNKPSTPRTCSSNSSQVGGNSFGHRSTSQNSRTISKPFSGMARVTKTFGFDIVSPQTISDMITDMDPNRFATHSLNDSRILRVLAAALEAVDPFKAVQKYLPDIQGKVYGLGIGKAAIPMMDALAERTPLTGGLAVTKFGAGLHRESFAVIEGGHPIPDARSLQAGERVLEFVSSLQEDDTLVCLISGGGSALVTAPYVPLEDLQTLTSLLLSSGARIDEINTLRRQLDRLKGGGLARATKAKIISLILSDVIGNPLEAIASGPTAPDPTTKKDARHILKKYDLEQRVPDSILLFLEYESLVSIYQEQAHGLQHVQNIIIGDNKLAAQAALEQAEHEGFHAEILTDRKSVV